MTETMVFESASLIDGTGGAPRSGMTVVVRKRSINALLA